MKTKNADRVSGQVDCVVITPEIGMRVKDYDGIIGIITECLDLHNIEVDYDNGGKGLYCIDPDCPEYDGLLAL